MKRSISIDQIIISQMNTWTIILAVYIISVIAWAVFIIIKDKHGRLYKNDKFGRVFKWISIPLAPICWIICLITFINMLRKRNKPLPLPKALQGKLQSDLVVFNGSIKSISEVNAITGKNYSIAKIYGKKYLERPTDKEINDIESLQGKLKVGENVRKDNDYEIVHRFAEARMTGNMESIREVFDPNVVVIDYGEKTITGIDAAISFWNYWYNSSVSRKVRFDFFITMCMFYNGPALIETPKGYADRLVLFKIHNGLITQMVLAPKFLSDEYRYFGGFREAPYTRHYFAPFLKQKIETRPNSIPCPNCGEVSENLEWYTFDWRERLSVRRYLGNVSICPHCNRTVEIHPTKCLDNPFYNGQSDEEYKERYAPTRIHMPELICYSFDYSRPLAGSQYIANLDNSSMFDLDLGGLSFPKEPEYEPCTAQTCAAEFHPLMLSKISRKDSVQFNEICDCYKKAYEDGIIEAGNNLAILYYNYGDRADEGKDLFRKCAEMGCANASTNYFTVLRGDNETLENAIQYALNTTTPSIHLYWNLAVLYLRGQEIEGNILDINKDKAKYYLNQILSGTIPGSGDDGDFINKARDILRKIDDFDQLAYTAREFVDGGISNIISTASNDRSQEYDLHRYLRHIRFPDDTTLKLQLPSEENGNGDISRFQLFNREQIDDNPICTEDNIIYMMDVDKSIYGAWDVYLFSKAKNLLPFFWHGGYNRESLLFDADDLQTIQSQRGRCQEVILKGDDLKPKVYFEGDTAIVECCVWSEWGGLYRETYSMLYSGRQIVEFKQIRSENIYQYDCGIMF